MAFPTTIWTTIREAGADDPRALEIFARGYRAPVLEFVRSKGFAPGDAEDVCQDIFLRVLAGNVLTRADRLRGRFRGLLLSVATHVIQDRFRKRREEPVADLEVADRDPDFDRAWTLHLTERAMARLKEAGSPYHEVLRGHLSGQPQNRNKLWIARRKLVSLIRAEVAQTCNSPEDYEEEIAYLSEYLRPRKKD